MTTRAKVPPWADETILVDVVAVSPPHGIKDPRKLRRLTEHMRRHGWVGRPLLVAPYAGGYVAWTDSHRLVAARAARLGTVPIYVIAADEEMIDGTIELIGGVTDDYDRATVLDVLGDSTASAIFSAEK